MTMDRRQFLKIAGGGLSAVCGLGALTLSQGEIVKEAFGQTAAEEVQIPEGLTAKRWAMVIDTRRLRRDEDYQRCIDACHRVHNVPELDKPKVSEVDGHKVPEFDKKRHEIKWIWKTKYENAFPGASHEFMPREIKEKPFLVLCNHCDNPPCVRVCPTKATFKRKDGIVVMDMHRCIGCRFCMAACPYGARSFNFRDPKPFVKEENPEYPTRMKGVVEKCNFCSERLAKGKEPACAEASGGAIVFGDLDDPNSSVRRILQTAYTIRRKPELGTGPNVYYVIR
jgi:molybdopterin-containing oxidoreductase family iron-sulfur binding subunit